jgi:hypothetical protein
MQRKKHVRGAADFGLLSVFLPTAAILTHLRRAKVIIEARELSSLNFARLEGSRIETLVQTNHQQLRF